MQLQPIKIIIPPKPEEKSSLCIALQYTRQETNTLKTEGQWFLEG